MLRILHHRLITLFGIAGMASCAVLCNKKEGDPGPEPNQCMYLGQDTCQQPVKTTIAINLGSEKQTIHSFGASDCWTTKFFGNWSNVQKKNQIADLLFSMDTAADGTPKGIGLSQWRFNIGGGSFEQGDASNITTDWRREECFMNADGTWNWAKQSGQQWFLQAAKQRGVKYTLGFSLTPPVFMTKNGKAFNPGTTPNMNIQDGKMDAYASFLAEVTKHFQFDYLSPVNEPQWTWGGSATASQEGTQATNTEITSLVKLIAPKLSGTPSKITIGEAGQWNYLYTNNTDGRGDQITQFFSSASSNYVGNVNNVERCISGHSYFTTCPDDNMIAIRNQVAGKISQVDASLQTWQTEFGILGNICNLYNGSPRNISIDYGLYVAKVIHHDLAIANISSWSWWLSVSPYDYSDALVYINDPSGSININNCKQDGIVLDSKQLWAFGNYARFVRPGMKRVDLTVQGISDPVIAANALMVSAYKEASNKKLVVVMINPKTTERTVQLSGTTITGNSMNAYTTNGTQGLKKSVVQANNIKIPPQSVMTVTGTYE
jgi:hypothetical protein